MPQNARWNPLNTPFLIGTLLLAAILVPIQILRTDALLMELAVSLGMFLAVGTAITAGYHRLFSHRSYQTVWPVRFLLLCLGAAAFQNSALRWASDHRLHHRHVDTERDPYSIKRGFWHAHWIWVMESTSHPLQGVADLERDPLVRWQDRYYFLIGAVVACIPVAIGLATGNVWGHIVMGVLLRIVLTHHSTFLINSAAHVFGTQPYTDTNTARDNRWLALFTYGEGYHNFHHMWPADYRNGVRWFQWDTTKWLVALLSVVGLARKLRRTPVSVIERAKLKMEEKRLQSKLGVAPLEVRGSLQMRLSAARERLDGALVALHAWRETRRIRKAAEPHTWSQRKAEWKATLAAHRAELQEAWREWHAARLAVRRLAAA